jgi:hypothetical protein
LNLVGASALGKVMGLKFFIAGTAIAIFLGGCGEQSAKPKSEQSTNSKAELSGSSSATPPAAAPASAEAGQTIAPKDAANYEGKTVTVCGLVTTARYLGENTGRTGSRNPTFLNFGEKFPNHDFTGVIFEADREKFGQPEKSCLNKNVCITGKVQIFRGKPEIIITEPVQMKGC